MKFDHTIACGEVLAEAEFHLACGYYTTTSFLFKEANFAVVIDCGGEFTFYTVDGEVREVIRAKPMVSGRGVYEDIFITTTDTAVIFKLPEYTWIDHYPNCDGESDRWSSRIIGIRDEITYAYQK